jgi:hypothetical protein
MNVNATDVEVHVFTFKNELYAVIENPSRISKEDFTRDRWFTDLSKIQPIHDQLNDGTEYPEFPDYTTLFAEIGIYNGA